MRARTYTQARAHTHTHTHARAHSRTRIHTHARTHARSWRQLEVLWVRHKERVSPELWLEGRQSLNMSHRERDHRNLSRSIHLLCHQMPQVRNKTSFPLDADSWPNGRNVKRPNVDDAAIRRSDKCPKLSKRDNVKNCQSNKKMLKIVKAIKKCQKLLTKCQKWTHCVCVCVRVRACVYV